MLSDSQAAAADRLAQAMIDQEYNHWRERNPEKFAQTPPELFAEFEMKEREKARAMAETILTPRGLWERARRGAFHPSNPNYRRLLEDLRGVQLPRGANDTRAALREMVGAAAWDAFEKEITDAEEAKEREKRAAAEAKERARIESLCVKVKSGGSVTGDELVDVARSLGVDVHPRTVSLLRNRVVSIDANSARITGKGNSGLAFSIYWECVAKLTPEPTQGAAECATAAALFAVPIAG